MAKTTQKQPKITMNDDKILAYLENQLTLKREQLKTYEMPLDTESIKDIRKVEELILKRNIFQLEDQIQAIKAIIGK